MELIGVLLAKFPTPLSGEEFLHVAVAETESKIEPDAMADDLGWEAVMLCIDRSVVYS